MFKGITINFTESMCQCNMNYLVVIDSPNRTFIFKCPKCDISMEVPFEKSIVSTHCDVWHKEEIKKNVLSLVKEQEANS